MTKCVIYARVSTQAQDDKKQIKALNKYARDNKYKVVKVFGEKVSGYDPNAERVEYDRMKDYVISNEIKLILVWEISRIGRTAIRSNNEIDFFKKNGVNIYIKDKDVNTLSEDNADKFYISILSQLAEMERDSIISRGKRGRLQSAMQGKRAGFGRMPYGFTADSNGYLIIEETEGKWVKQMYKWLANGKSIKGIATQLNAQSVPTRHTTEGRLRKLADGSHVKILWRSNSVKKILTSKLYNGVREYSGEEIVIKKLIDDKLWEAVQDKLSENINNQLNTKYEYLLKGKIYCGKCGLAYMARTEKKCFSETSFYFCSGRKDKAIKCDNGQFKKEVLDYTVYSLLKSHQDLLKQMKKESYEKFDVESKQKEIDFFKEEIIKLEKLRNKNKVMFRNEDVTEKEYIKESKRIRNTIREYENNITHIQNEIDSFIDKESGEYDMLFDFLDKKDFKSKRKIVEDYIDKVLIYRVDNFAFKFSHLLCHQDLDDGEGLVAMPLEKPHGNDKIVYVELFAFGNDEPLKMFVSNVSDILYVSQELEYDKDTRTLHKTGGADYPSIYYPYPLED